MLGIEKVECKICKKVSANITKTFRICGSCIKKYPEKSIPLIEEVHRNSRIKYNLPYKISNGFVCENASEKITNYVSCKICTNNCKIPLGQRGYCGLRYNKDGKLTHIAGVLKKGILDYYYDPLPTNCVADQFCAGGTGVGYPKYAYKKSAEYGYKNLAVFYKACSYNCIFCQNWHYRYGPNSLSPIVSAEELANAVDKTTSCICFFGGDPTPQLMHAIKSAQIAIEKNKNRILRICWESNGTMNIKFLKKVAELSLNSGGCVKFDLKCWDENLNLALCNASNKQTLKNFEYLATFIKERKIPPFLIASTLLIPGYVDENEVENIAKFIANLDVEIPYNLLAFYPQFLMNDLPTTTKEDAENCYRIAKKAGLKNVRIGNVHLLA